MVPACTDPSPVPLLILSASSNHGDLNYLLQTRSSALSTWALTDLPQAQPAST